MEPLIVWRSDSDHVRRTRNCQYIPTDDELDDILSAVALYSDRSFRDTLVCGLMIHLGLRLKETLLLRLEDIDWLKRTILLRGSSTKSKKGAIMPLPEWLYVPLEKYVLVTHMLIDRKNWSPIGWLFPSNKSVMSPMTPNYWRERFNKCMQKARLRQVKGKCSQGHTLNVITPHCFRRYFMVKLREDNPGADLFQLADAARAHPWTMWKFYAEYDSLTVRRDLICKNDSAYWVHDLAKDQRQLARVI